VNKISRVTFPHVFGALIGITALAHIPSSITMGAFDRNAAPQFLLLALTGMVGCLQICLKRSFSLDKKFGASVAALMVFTTISLLASDSYISSLIGDTGRFSGLISLWSFVAIALVASSFDLVDFTKSLFGICLAIVAVTLLGFLQSFNIVKLPGDGGTGSTLGNLDFLSAWIGTTLIIIFLYFKNENFPRLIFLMYLVVALVTLWRIGAKQGFLDLILIIFSLAAVKVFRRFDFSEISARTWKVVATFGLLLWSEIIYLIPMSGLHFPGISDDVNVRIRTDFWYSAAHMFFNNFSFGVGPDNYGNYYEKYRSLSSVRNSEYLLSNDAHSSMMQTFATLGFFATVAFLLLILLTIYSFINLIKRNGASFYGYLLIAFFVFYTNALISPITLPNKAIFWCIAGFVIGQDIRSRGTQLNKISRVFLTVPAGIVGVVITVTALAFAVSFFTLNQALAEAKTGKKVNYTISKTLPCVVYSNAQLSLAPQSRQDLVTAAQEILEAHPRCLDILGFLAQDALSRKDYKTAKLIVYQLLDVSPARQTVVRLAAIYAVESNDNVMKDLLTEQGVKLGLVKKSQVK